MGLHRKDTRDTVLSKLKIKSGREEQMPPVQAVVAIFCKIYYWKVEKVESFALQMKTPHSDFSKVQMAMYENEH